MEKINKNIYKIIKKFLLVNFIFIFLLVNTVVGEETLSNTHIQSEDDFELSSQLYKRKIRDKV